MGAITIQGIRFNIYPNDHDPPHVDVEIYGRKMKIHFAKPGQMPEIGPTDHRIKDSDAKRAYRIFCSNQGKLMAIYKEVQNAKK